MDVVTVQNWNIPPVKFLEQVSPRGGFPLAANSFPTVYVVVVSKLFC